MADLDVIERVEADQWTALDFDAVVVCADPTCEFDHPPAVAKLTAAFDCHTITVPICVGCTDQWAGVLLIKGLVFAVCMAESCRRAHLCLARAHYTITDL